MDITMDITMGLAFALNSKTAPMTKQSMSDWPIESDTVFYYYKADYIRCIYYLYHFASHIIQFKIKQRLITSISFIPCHIYIFRESTIRFARNYFF